MINPFYAKNLPQDPYTRKLFQIICDHIRTTLDPEITEIRYVGVIPARHVNAPYHAIEAYQRDVLITFKYGGAVCGDENRCWGPLQVGHQRWSWHFERRKLTDLDKKANKNEIGIPMLIFSN